MPNYEVHLGVGAPLGLVIGFGVHDIFSPVLPPDYAFMAGVVAFECVCVGSVLPDIDLHNSKPRQLLNAGLSFSAALAVYLTVIFEAGNGFPAPDIVHLLAAVPAFFTLIFALAVLPPLVQAVMPGHRLWLHNPLPYLVAFFAPAFAIWHGYYSLPGIDYAIQVVFIAPALFALFFGVLIHLFLDGPTWRSEQQRYMA